jgi:hypothetical protein
MVTPALRLTPVDAQFYWMSAKIPNDQVQLFAFAGTPASLAAAVEEVRTRALACPELRLKVDDGCGLTYPTWIRGDVGPGQLVVHQLDRPDWLACLDAAARISADQLDLRQMSWRLTVFTPVHDVPGCPSIATVAVLQVGHALADGNRGAALAGVLFGRTASVPVAITRPPGCLLLRGIDAAVAHRQQVHATDTGLLPLPAGPVPALITNSAPAGARRMRTVVRRRSAVPGPTVTVGVLAAVSTALSGYLRTRGTDPTTLTAEVPMAKPGVRYTNNHFRNVGVGLHPDVSPATERAGSIAADLERHRRRSEHPALAAEDAAFAAVPAPLLRWGVAQLDPAARSATVTGNTVVSSVNRGAADLRFGGCPVLVTAGYPALSPMMGLTHGVHGIGDTIAVSVHAAESAIADIDDYLDRLDVALRES